MADPMGDAFANLYYQKLLSIKPEELENDPTLKAIKTFVAGLPPAEKEKFDNTLTKLRTEGAEKRATIVETAEQKRKTMETQATLESQKPLREAAVEKQVAQLKAQLPPQQQKAYLSAVRTAARVIPSARGQDPLKVQDAHETVRKILSPFGATGSATAENIISREKTRIDGQIQQTKNRLFAAGVGDTEILDQAAADTIRKGTTLTPRDVQEYKDRHTRKQEGIKLISSVVPIQTDPSTGKVSIVEGSSAGFGTKGAVSKQSGPIAASISAIVQGDKDALNRIGQSVKSIKGAPLRTGLGAAGGAASLLLLGPLMKLLSGGGGQPQANPLAQAQLAQLMASIQGQQLNAQSLAGARGAEAEANLAKANLLNLQASMLGSPQAAL